LRTLNFVLVLLLLTRLASGSTTISLTRSQSRALAKLVASEPAVKKLFHKIQHDAEASLANPGRPLVHLGTAGRLAADPLKIQSRASLEDMKDIESLGYAYTVTGKRVYSTAARRLVLSWARTNEPDGV